MKKKTKITFWLTLLVFTLPVLGCIAQVEYKLNWSKSSMTIVGTSSLHDWEMQVKEAKGSIILEEKNNLNKFNSGSINVVSTSLNSDHSLMDKKAYEALNTKDYPLIRAKIKNVAITNLAGKATIDMSIAGVSESVTSDFKLQLPDSGELQIIGELALKLTDFKIAPPVALFGTIKTGDSIVVKYKLTYEKE